MKNIEKFRSDIVQKILNAYNSAGIKYNGSNKDYFTVMREYITMLNRLIGPRKRKVHISAELINKISGNDNESKRLKKLVDDMETKLTNGTDVNGHLSKCIFNELDKTDKMLDDWNIYHLHMCEGNPDIFDYSRTQSGDLLMAVVLYDDAYFLDVTNHSKDDWFEVDYIRIMKNNWKDELLIEAKEVVDVPNLNESINAIKKLREANINQIIHEIDGSYYYVKYAMGYSSGSTSLKATDYLFNLNNYLEQLDFNYDHMEFNEFNINYFCKLYDDDESNYVKLTRNIP